MTDGIGRIFGGNNYGVNSYASQRKNEAKEEVAQENKQPNYEETQVDPSKVMEFMAANNFFIAPTNSTTETELDAETVARIGNYMENFEVIYGLIVDEFGEELAPMVMDMVMDKLIGKVAA